MIAVNDAGADESLLTLHIAPHGPAEAFETSDVLGLVRCAPRSTRFCPN
jgi:hypothetical protein